MKKISLALITAATLLATAACSDSVVGPTPVGGETGPTNFLTLAVDPSGTVPTGLLVQISGGRVDSLVATSGSAIQIIKVEGTSTNGGGQFVLVKKGGLPANLPMAAIYGPKGNGYAVQSIEGAGADYSVLGSTAFRLQLTH